MKLIPAVLALCTLGYTLTCQAELDCAPLDPRESISKEQEFQVKGSVDTLYKVAKAGGSIEAKAKQQIQNLQQSAPAAQQDPIKLRVLYAICGLVSGDKSLSTERKVQLFMEMTDVKTSSVSPTPGTSAARQSEPAPPPRHSGHAPKSPVDAIANPTKSPEKLDGTYVYQTETQPQGPSTCYYRDKQKWILTVEGGLLKLQVNFVHSGNGDDCSSRFVNCVSILRIVPVALSGDSQSTFRYEAVAADHTDPDTGLFVTKAQPEVNAAELKSECSQMVPTAGLKGKLTHEAERVLLSYDDPEKIVTLTRN